MNYCTFPMSATILSGLLGLLCAACTSSKGTAQVSEEGGKISGKVEQILHHGAYNPEGTNRTITPLVGIQMIITDTTGAAIDTLFSDSTGAFSGVLETGTYILTPPPQRNEMVPGTTPPPQRIDVHRGETTAVMFHYQVYAP